MRLNRTGVPAELYVYPGVCDGYQMAAESETAGQSRRDNEDRITRQIR